MSTIDRRSSTPYYEQLAGLLLRDIESNKPPTGVYQLPSENSLAARHRVSRTTIRHALDALEREGYVYREKGKGSFAATRRVEHELTDLVSTTEEMRRRGWAVDTQVVRLERLPQAPPAAQRALELSEDDAVYLLCRLRIVDRSPLSVQTTYLPAALCPDLEENDLTDSLYRLLDARYGIRLWTGTQTLRARGATLEESQLLEIEVGEPVMYAERVTYSSTGMAVEYLEATWSGERFDFKVALRRID